MTWNFVFATMLLSAQVEAGNDTKPDGSALQAAVATAADRYCEAFAKQDAKALAALFTSEAEYVDASGTVFHGRAAIEAEFAATFAEGLKSTLEIDITSIRPIADGVLVEDGVSTVRLPDDGAAMQARYTATHVRQADGTWLLAGVRELSEPLISPHDRLRDLAWLVGRWREETPDGVVATEWAWSKDSNALVASFSLRGTGAETKQGTHRIGWDAERKQFRSWVFDSSGGFADGWWSTADDGSWIVQLHGADAEGAHVTSTLNYLRDGDAMVIAQRDRTRGGIGLPDVAVRVVRQPPEPGKTASAP